MLTKETRGEKRERERQEAFKKQCQENEAKGLTWAGYTKSFEGQSKIFYMNNIAIRCTVDYELATPHIEFRGEPSVLTETGYRSHFTRTELGQFSAIEEMVEAMVAQIMSLEEKCHKEYTLTWEPSLEYLEHSPEQLMLFGEKEAALC